MIFMRKIMIKFNFKFNKNEIVFKLVDWEILVKIVCFIFVKLVKIYYLVDISIYNLYLFEIW